MLLSRPLNLRQPHDLKDAVSLIEVHQKELGVSATVAAEGLSFLGTQVPFSSDLRMVHLGGISVRIASGKDIGLDLRTAVDLGVRLKRLSIYDRFDRFLATFSNARQIEDTIFETAVASFCIEKRGVSNLRFAPEYVLGGSVKRPDFEVDTVEGTIVCECKRVHVEEHRFSKRLDRIFSKLWDVILTISVESNLRVDVALVGIIKGDVDRAVSNVGSAIRRAFQSRDMCEMQSGAFKFRLAEKGQPPSFPGMDLQKTRSAAHFPVEMDRQTGLTPHTDLWLGAIDRDLERVAGDLMNDAKKQLPRTKRCAIFIRGGSVSASVRAAERRVNESAYEHIVCFGIEDDPIRLVSRTENQALVKQLLT